MTAVKVERWREDRHRALIEKLTAERKAKGISQQQLAQRVPAVRVGASRYCASSNLSAPWPSGERMNDDPPQAAPNVDAAYAAALDAAMNAPTPQARAKAVDEMEAIAKQQVETADGPVSHEGPQEGFEAPKSGLAYQFEQNLPPGVEILDATALGVFKSSLAVTGMPAELGNAAFGDVARLEGQGAFSNEATYVEACEICRAQIERVHAKARRA